MIEKPPMPGALTWPGRSSGGSPSGVFAEDRMAVEAEQRAWDEQGQDCNREVFPLILDVRDVLRSNGVPIRPGLCASAASCAASCASAASCAAAAT